MTITGTNFTGTTAVYFGTTVATSFTLGSDTSLTAVAPLHVAGTVDVLVITSYGGGSSSSAADQFTYLAGAAPTVTTLNPTSGPASGGTLVTITGTGFTHVSAVSFGSRLVTSFTVNSATSITATAPAQAGGLVDVTVTTLNGTSAITAGDRFTYIADGALTPTGVTVTPTEGAVFTGIVATFTHAGANTDASIYSAVIAWGDGHLSLGTVAWAGMQFGLTFNVTGTNTYIEEGTYAVRVQINDVAGSTAIGSSTANVAILARTVDFEVGAGIQLNPGSAQVLPFPLAARQRVHLR